jgi:hypothetical protein
MIGIEAVLQNPVVLTALKISTITLIGLYTIFSFVVLRQVSLMNKTFQTDFGGLFKLVAALHFVAVLIVLVLAIILL